ncbi:bacillithiol biosynthesis deacetylase BshB1 [Fodinisporobacter ferrooxydans]|uniref:Bacillithiol biosynthesis deacetylase BshB1 n=1 Tax=Fodinisporobacter ferrooxydans TaxID=2901836 RepID=A0ABY4CGQ2_9BACL|nr:bacillithiol biosynthesis deacetylase BshB1 [Alicyclobacillaceae bacterium MYW30-H2]
MTEDFTVLAFGAHPDDVEIGAGGILALHAELGYKVGICDLTEAEMSSNGTVETRRQEAQRAADILGVQARFQLHLQDRGLRLERFMIDRVVGILRETRPRIILAPHPSDRHPDHGWCAQIVREAWFSAGLRKYQPADSHAEPYRPQQLYYYFINDTHSVPLAVDVSSVYGRKREALLAYATQFQRQSGKAETPLNNGIFLNAVEGRDAMFGQQINARFAEGLLPAQLLAIQDLTTFA